MKQKNSKISSYNKIRNNLYANVERHELTERKTFGIIAICALLLAAALLFTAAMIEIGSRVKYTYIFGDIEQVLDEDLALLENVIYIDMNALADYCNMSTNASTFTSNSTSVTFENGSDTATVNGLTLQLTNEAIITNDLCLSPLADAESMIHGIKATVSGTSIQINMSSQIYIINRNPSVSYLTDVTEYMKYINSNDPYIKTLTNKQNKIDRYFEPSDLVEIPAKYRRTDRVLKLSLTAEKAIPDVQRLSPEELL